MKMKDDTLNFNKLWISNFYSFSEKSCDPFLIQASILPKQNVVVGGGIRSLLQKKTE
jgi:hypothetical protein